MSQLDTATGCLSTDEAEFDLARQIQSTFVPEKCYGWPGTRIAARRIAGGGLGGDFHDVIRGLDEQYTLIVGTITGPGLFAALGKAVLSGAARKFGPISRSPRVLMDQLNRLLGRINANLRDQCVRCSVFIGLVDRARGILDYSSAGCCRALVWSREGELYDLQSTGAMLGGSANLDCGSERLELTSLRRLVIYTDGLTTARSISGQPLGMARGRRLLTDTVRLPADKQVEVVLQGLRNHVGPDRVLTDDVTVFLTEFMEGVTAPGADSMRTWLRSYDRAGGTVPDSSVFLG